MSSKERIEKLYKILAPEPVDSAVEIEWIYNPNEEEIYAENGDTWIRITTAPWGGYWVEGEGEDGEDIMVLYEKRDDVLDHIDHWATYYEHPEKNHDE